MTFDAKRSSPLEALPDSATFSDLSSPESGACARSSAGSDPRFARPVFRAKDRESIRSTLQVRNQRLVETLRQLTDQHKSVRLPQSYLLADLFAGNTQEQILLAASVTRYASSISVRIRPHPFLMSSASIRSSVLECPRLHW